MVRQRASSPAGRRSRPLRSKAISPSSSIAVTKSPSAIRSRRPAKVWSNAKSRASSRPARSSNRACSKGAPTIIWPALVTGERTRRISLTLTSRPANSPSPNLNATAALSRTRTHRAGRTALAARLEPPQHRSPGHHHIGRRYCFELKPARRALLDHFGVKTLEAYGVRGQPLATQAAGAIIIYLRDTQADALTNLNNLQTLHDR